MGHRVALGRVLSGKHPSRFPLPMSERHDVRVVTARASSNHKQKSLKTSSKGDAGTGCPTTPLNVSFVDKTFEVLNTRAAPMVGSVGLLVLGVAIASVAHRLLKLNHEKTVTSSSSATSSSPSSSSELTADEPILFSELEAKMMSPLLLAAETAAEVDETAKMSVSELEDLEVTLRTLLSGMDAQLEELKCDVLDQGVIPEDVLVEMDDTGAMDGLEMWNEFQLFQGYISDQERRSFRSLLYNRSVQLKLLDQVERQIVVKKRVSSARTDVADVADVADVGDVGDVGQPCESVDDDDDREEMVGSDAQLFYASGATAPHAQKVEKGGEDAFFVDCVGMVMGIADGVGGWERLGVDPAAYSRELMAQCEAVGAAGNASCMQILQKGFQRTAVPGSSTAIIAKYLALEGRLDVVSVGDCSMRVVRRGEVVLRTEVQEHAWNQPFQLSHPTFNEADTPEDALEFSFEVMPGDVVVMGSDGLWDNMWDDELLEAVAASDAMRRWYEGNVQWQKEAEELAQRLLELAEAHSLDEAYASPFAEERDALRRRSETFLTRVMNNLNSTASTAVGGKQDDITAVVAILG